MQPVVKAVQNVYSLWWGILKSPSRWVLDYPQEVVDLLLLLLLIQAVPLFLVCVILLQVWTLFLCTLVTKCLHSTFPSAGGWQTANPTPSTWPRTFWPPLFGFSSLTCCSERKSSGRFRRRGQTRMPEDIVYIVGAGGKADFEGCSQGTHITTHVILQRLHFLLYPLWKSVRSKVSWLLARIQIFSERMCLRSVSEQWALISF